MGTVSRPREYTIRSLAYYQAEGGVYNEIITVLTQMRKEPKFRGLPAPAKALDDACYFYDMKKKDWTPEEDMEFIRIIEDDLTKVLVALMITAWDDNGFLIACDRSEFIEKSNPYLAKFDALFEHYMHEEEEARNSYGDALRIDELEEELKAKESELKVKDGQLEEANVKIEELQKLVDSLKVKNESKFDKALSRKGIMEYIKNQGVYKNANQLFEMLLYMSRVATDEEYDEVVALRQRMIDAEVPVKHIEIHNSNVFTGVVNHPLFPIGGDPEEVLQKALELYQKSLNDGKEG